MMAKRTKYPSPTRQTFGLLMALLLVASLLPLIAVTSESVQASPDSDWWNDDWQYKKVNPINGSTAGAQENYQMRMRVHAGTGTDNSTDVFLNNHGSFDNFQDVRWVQTDNVECDFWIENFVSGDYADFWVEVPSVPASPSTVDVSIYYGNSDATSLSDGDATFKLFDDFENGTIDTNKWLVTQGGGTVEETGGYLRIYTADDSDYNNIVGSKATFSDDFLWYFDIDVVSDEGNYYFLNDVNNASVPSSNGAGLWQHDYSNEWYWYKMVGGVKTNVGDSNSRQGRFEIEEKKYEGTKFRGLYNGAVEGSDDAITNQAYYLTWGMGWAYCEIKVHLTYVRSYVTPEPIWGAWGGEEEPLEVGWLSGWSYRKQQTITGTTAGAQENYQMKMVVHKGAGTDNATDVFCGGNCKDDFGDIRWTEDNGTTPMDYWIESIESGVQAVFWGEIPSIPAGAGTVDVYLYYDNPEATSIGNFDDTFIFGDPFDSDTLDTTRWPSVDGNPSYSINTTNHYLEITNMDAGAWDGGKGFHSKSISLPSEWRFEAAYGTAGAKMYLNSTVAELTRGMFSVHHGSWTGGDYGIAFAMNMDAWVSSTGEAAAGVGGNYDYRSGEGSKPQEFTIEWLMHKLSGTIVIKEDGTQRVSEANSEIPSIFHLGISRLTGYTFGTVRFYAFKIRNYADPEPTWGTWGGEETANVAPNIPTNLQPSVRQITTNVTISCDVTDNDGDQMNVHFYDNSDNSLIDNIWADNGTTASVTWGSLTRGNTYTFFAGAQDNNGNWGENSATQSFMVNSLPTIPTNFTDLGMNLTDHSPTITWTKGTDDDGDTVTTYIYLGTTSTPIEVDASTTGETDDLGENTSHSCYPLTDGSTYYYRLRSWDGYEWSTSYTIADQFRMNTPPTVPTNLQPSEVQTTTSVTISCVGTDNEGDNVNVHFYNNSDNSLIDNIWIENGQTAEVSWNDLEHGRMYVFFAGAQDAAGEWGENSDTQSFWVILHGPELDKPIENQPYFEWSDLYADNYRLLVDNNPAFSSPIEDRILTENHYQIPPENALDNGVYYWKVIAYFDGEAVESDVWSFVVGAVGEIVEEPAKPILDPMFLLVLSIVLMTTALAIDSTPIAFFGGVSALFVGFMFLDTLWFAMIMIGLGIYFMLASALSVGED